MTPPHPLLSVVMPVRNCGIYIRTAIDSILGQTFRNFEFIIIDDGSTDRTTEIVQSYQDERIIFYREAGRGVANSLNKGISSAKGEFIARQDADDISEPTRFELQLNTLCASESLGLIGTWANLIDEYGAIIRAISPPCSNKDIQKQLLTSNLFVHGSVMMRRAALEDVGLYREEFLLSQSYDLWLRLAEKYKVENIPRILYRYRIWPKGVSVQCSGQNQLFRNIGKELAQQRRKRGKDCLQEGNNHKFYEAYGEKILEAYEKKGDFLWDNDKNDRPDQGNWSGALDQCKFLPPHIKRIGEKRLNDFVKILHNEIRSRNIEVNIYLSGSGLRQEAFVTNREGEWHLGADIDMVLVTNEINWETSWLGIITKYFREAYPDFLASFAVLKNESKMLKSFAGKYLRLSMKKPVLEMFKVNDYNFMPLSSDDLIELVCNQIASYYLHPSVFDEQNTNSLYFRNKQQVWTKLLLECLRVQIPQLKKLDQIVRYSDVPELYNQMDDEGLLLPPSVVEQIQKSREYGMFDAIPTMDNYSFLLSAIAGILDISGETERKYKVYAALEKRCSSPGFRVLFELILISLALENEATIPSDKLFWQNKLKSKYCELISLAAFDCKASLLVEDNWIFEYKKYCSALRRQYSHEVYGKNYQEDFIPDIDSWPP